MGDSGARGMREGAGARGGRQGGRGGAAADTTVSRPRPRLRGGAALEPAAAPPGDQAAGGEHRAPRPASPRRGRPDGRKPGQLRPLRITPGYLKYAEGSALIEMGNTKVVCTASVEETVPPFLRNTGRGWVTAEYGMLPRSTSTRTEREAARGRIGGRTSEIQRLIGRCLRSVLDFEALGERQIRIDCDVLQADGGTRTAAITGAFVALALATDRLVRAGLLRETPILDAVAAVSVGVVGGRPVLDLAYEEDSGAEVDMNVAMTGSGRFIEVQGTAEQVPFTRAQMDRMTALAAESMRMLFAAQREALASVGVPMPTRGRRR